MAEATTTSDPEIAKTEEERSWLAQTWDSVADMDIGNKVLLVRRGLQQLAANTVALPGYAADLADWGVEKAGGDFFDGSAGDAMRDGTLDVMDAMDPLAWVGIKPEIETEADQALVDGVEFGAEVAIAIATLGAGGLKMAATRGAKSLLRNAGDDAARAAARSGDDVARAAGGSADDVAAAKKSFLGTPVTRGSLIAFSATPTLAIVGLSVAEHESGGAISDAAISSAVDAIKAADLELKNVEPYIDSMGYVAQIADTWNKAAQNQFVRAAMGYADDPTPEEIERGKLAAIGWQLEPDRVVLHGTKNIFRMAIADDLFETREEADRYLAREFVNDIVESAQVIALKDNPVTEEDIKVKLDEFLETSVGQTLIGGRLENGLRQLWPDIFDVQKQEVVAGQQNQSDSTLKTKMQSVFNDARRKVEDTAADLTENWQMPNWLMEIPVLGAIIGAVMWIAEKLGSFFDAVLNGDLLATGSERVSRTLAKAGLPAAGTTMEVVTHDGEERGQQPLTGPAALQPGMQPG